MRRDDFPKGVKQTIRQRVNSRCSNPQCGAPTGGPQVEPHGSLNIGVAAHITAASPGGPRFDENLSPTVRASGDNAIWLCHNCAKLVDNDPQRYPTAVLRRWKVNAEAHARESIGRPSPFEIQVTGAVLDIAGSTDALSIPNDELVAQLEPLLPRDIGTYHQVELLDHGSGGAGQPYAIVGAGRNFGWDWDVLFFTAGELGWDLIARATLQNQKAHVPIARYVAGRPGALVLTHVDGYGTGVFRRCTTWHRIAKGQAVQLLTYPFEFYVIGWGMPFGRVLKSTTAAMPLQIRTGERLELLFKIEYTIDEEADEHARGSFLFADQHSSTLVWNDNSERFEPLTSADDLSIVDERWSETTAAWIDRNIEKLAALRDSGNAQQRQFVARLLAAHTAPDGSH